MTTVPTDPPPPARSTPLPATRPIPPLVRPATSAPPAGTPTWLKVFTGVLAVLLVGVIAFGAYWAIRLQGNITKAPLSAGSDQDRGCSERFDGTGCRS